MAFNSGQPPDQRTRHRQGLHLRALNVEKGPKRFSSADDCFPPPTATWRNNLVALSQRRNILFVAYSHQIYVWEPAGSFQILGSKPEMIITPVIKEPNSAGYISPSHPHCINNILVDDLGREEVLLLVTDSGNICGYRVEAIFSTLKRTTGNEDINPLNDSQVDPFFVEYVDASAWGLAIHKFARLIAVTANTGIVTVFAFALVNSIPAKGKDLIDDDDHFTDYGQTWLHIRTAEQLAQLRHLMPEKHRTRNIKLTYTGHFANIPSVSFLNCDIDPNGTWMVSTDIENKLLVWKVWESLGPFTVYHFNDMTFKTFPDTLRNDGERGWAVLALDPRTFHLLKSTEEACGGQPLHRRKDGQLVLDLTKLTNRVPNASHLYNYFPPAVRTEPEHPVLPDIFGADCRVNRKNNAPKSVTSDKRDIPIPPDPEDLPEASTFSTGSGSFRPSDSADTFSHRAVDGSVREDTMSNDSATDADSDTDNQEPTGHGELLQALGDSNAQTGTLPPGHGPLTTPEFLQFALLEALGGDVQEVEEFLGENLGHIGEHDYFQDEEMDDVDDDSSEDDTSDPGVAAYQVFNPPISSNFPILHFSQTDIRLVSHPFAPHASAVCAAPLRQPFTHPILPIRSCDRFNMVKYIPEHGIVVAASQKGRAAVIALTETKATGLSFRIDWIVPLESQEKYGDRPLIPLLGMAVSPIQGFEIPPDVSYIPRKSDDTTPIFRYKYTSNTSHGETTPGPPLTSSTSSGIGSSGDSVSSSSDPSGSGPGSSSHRLTLPESHARATRAYQPEESWRGWNPSRRYRLLLMYADHTVMSYEFWYTWSKSPSGRGDDSPSDEEEYLIV